MEKMIIIKVGAERDKLETGIKTAGFNDDSILDQLQLLGIMVNLQWVIQQRIIKLGGIRANGTN